jgi:hypothetical protein
MSSTTVIKSRIPAIERAFDKALGNGNWAPVEQAMLEPANRAEAVAIISTEVNVSKARANEIGSAIVSSIKKDPGKLTKEKSFSAANHHPAHGQSRHGLAILDLTTPKSA